MTKPGSFLRLIRNLRRTDWISVTERLPEHDQPVLARFKPVEPLYDGQPPFEMCVAAYDAEKAKVKSRAKISPVRELPRCDWYRYAARGDTCYYFAATHWRPLP